MIAVSEATMRRFHCELYIPMKVLSPNWMVYFFSLLRNMRGLMKSFHVLRKVKSPTLMRAGLESGRIILVKMIQCPAPSIKAASSSSLGMVLKNCRNRNMLNIPPPKMLAVPMPNQEGSVRGTKVSVSPSFVHMMKLGISVAK